MRIAISGHRGLSAETTSQIASAIRSQLNQCSNEVIGLSCLADGADQIFARAVLDHGGQIEIVIPARQYREGLPEESQPTYDELLSHAVVVHEMPFHDSTPESHMKASMFMLDHADELWAVWDGKPARAFGGTADVVAYARHHGLPVRIIWPAGATRD